MTRNEEDYRKAAEAVKAGCASKEQKEMNAQAAKQAGSFGNRAREAYK